MPWAQGCGFKGGLAKIICTTSSVATPAVLIGRCVGVVVDPHGEGEERSRVHDEETQCPRQGGSQRMYCGIETRSPDSPPPPLLHPSPLPVMRRLIFGRGEPAFEPPDCVGGTTYDVTSGKCVVPPRRHDPPVPTRQGISKCKVGTTYDDRSHSCVVTQELVPRCREGMTYDDTSHSCVTQTRNPISYEDYSQRRRVDTFEGITRTLCKYENKLCSNDRDSSDTECRQFREWCDHWKKDVRGYVETSTVAPVPPPVR